MPGGLPKLGAIACWACALMGMLASAYVFEAGAASRTARVRVTITLPSRSIVYCYSALRKPENAGVDPREISACQGYAITHRPALMSDGPSGVSSPYEPPAGARRVVNGVMMLEFVDP